MNIIDKDEFVRKLKKNMKIDSEDIAIFTDMVMSTLYECFEDGYSIKYEDYPLMKTKISEANYHENSPRTKREDKVFVGIKVKKRNANKA